MIFKENLEGEVCFSYMARGFSRGQGFFPSLYYFEYYYTTICTSSLNSSQKRIYFVSLPKNNSFRFNKILISIELSEHLV
jgi:hypothetical protein